MAPLFEKVEVEPRRAGKRPLPKEVASHDGPERLDLVRIAFDDPVHEVFGIVSRDWQSFYHFTVGGPVEDVRLTTLPAYGPERGNLPDPTVPRY